MRILLIVVALMVFFMVGTGKESMEATVVARQEIALPTQVQPTDLTPDVLKGRGELLSFRYAMTKNKLNREQLDIIDGRLGEMVKTLHLRPVEPMGTDDFFIASYQDVSLYILPGVEHPEKWILVKKDDEWYTFEGEKQKLEDTLSPLPTGGYAV